MRPPRPSHAALPTWLERMLIGVAAAVSILLVLWMPAFVLSVLGIDLPTLDDGT